MLILSLQWLLCFAGEKLNHIPVVAQLFSIQHDPSDLDVESP